MMSQGTKLAALLVLAVAVFAAISPLTTDRTIRSRLDNEQSAGTPLAATTAFIVASLRAAEARRPDAVAIDPFAHQLAGDISAQVQLLAGFKWSPPDVSLPRVQELIALRTRYLDEALSHVDPTVRQVVILGAGLDTRAYRLEALHGRFVTEIDASKDLLNHKHSVMAQMNAQLVAARYHTITADLTNDSWDQLLLGEAGFDPTKQSFWCMEGLLPYIPRYAIVKVLKTIDALSPPGSSFWVDMCEHAVVEAGLLDCNAVKYGEDDPLHGVLSVSKWKLRVQADMGKPGEHFGREWTPVSLEGMGSKPVSVSFIIGTKPSDERKAMPMLEALHVDTGL